MRETAIKILALFFGLMAGLAGGMTSHSHAAEQAPAADQSAPEESGPPLEKKQPPPLIDRHGDALPNGAAVRLGTIRLRHGGAIGSAVFLPDGRQVASCGGFSDMTIALWEFPGGKEVRRFVGHTQAVNAIALSPDGKILASISADGTTRLWEVATGTEAIKINSHRGKGACIAFSPSGNQLASVGADGVVRLWEAGTGKEAVTFSQPGTRSLAFSPDGSTLALVPRTGNAVPRRE